MKLSNPILSARLATTEDEIFLRALYHSGRAAELAMFGFSPELERSFVQMQFHARKQHYANAFPSAQDFIVLHQIVPIGHILLNRADEVISIVDIALMPEFRGQGIGTSLLADVIQAADYEGSSIDLHVEYSSRAKALYQRLGFAIVEDTQPYCYMRRKAC